VQIVEINALSRETFRSCYRYAATCSADDRTQNGSMLVKNTDILAMGANRYPSQMLRKDELRDDKYANIIHAEEDAIWKAARTTMIPLNGSLLWCVWAPCMRCARAIVSAGITRLTVHKQMHDRTPERWRGEIEQAVAYIENAGVEYIRVNGKVGDCTNLFDGKIWKP